MKTTKIETPVTFEFKDLEPGATFTFDECLYPFLKIGKDSFFNLFLNVAHTWQAGGYPVFLIDAEMNWSISNR